MPPLRDKWALTESEALLLTQQVANLAASGLPLPGGLRALSAELGNDRAGRLALDLAERLERGQSFADALTDLEERMPPHLRDLLLASVRSGRLGPLLADFVSYARVGADLRRGLFLAFLYPALIVVAFGGFTILVYAYLVPQFVTIYDDFNLRLPWLSQFVVSLSRGFSVGLPRITIWLLGPPFLFLLAWRFLLDARSRRWVVCSVPLIGPIWHWAALAEFCHFLGLFIEAELPLERAVPLAADATSDAELVASSRWVEAELASGRALPSALARVAVFPEGMSRLLAWAEDRVALTESLHTLAELLTARAHGRASLVATAVVVFVVLLVLWAVMITVVGLFLPLIQLISQLSG